MRDRLKDRAIIITMTITSLMAMACPFRLSAQNNKQANAATLTSSDLASTSHNDSWRRVPINLGTQLDDVTPQLRTTRNDYWNKRLPPAGVTSNPGGMLGGAPEISNSPNSLWIVGTFKSYLVFLSSIGSGAYTEIQIKLNTIVNNESAAKVSVGDTLDIGEPGGTIRETDGTVHSYNLQLRPYPFEPGHMYLLQLTYLPQVNYFEVERRWDVSSGRLVPDGALEDGVYQEGRSKLAGLYTSQAISKLKTILTAR